ncbi:very long chain fatty acid elongase 6-like [Littorina saxatilis]|uniref:Elongation of very long chain fatty acids protein n=1 Tax=Littorina saxatilis TaxID=31220 RepID=A0AAN9BVG2_9CAEN
MAAAVEREGVHNYSYVFPFEKNWNESIFLKYMLERWTDSFVYAAIYVVVVFGGQLLMKTRPRYDLRPILALWSGILAIFSIAGAIRTVPELVTAVGKHSLQYSICVPTYFKGVTGFWSFLFTVSKVYELGDTLFIILRKQPLIFLHWYHHITVLLYVWYSYTDHTAPGRWFMVMNYVVHSLMYSYYALRALRISIPKWISIVITSSQLLQMIVGVCINIMIYQIKGRGEFCQQTYENLNYSSLMYFSYFVLFAHFFYTTYIIEKPKGVLPKPSDARDKKHA